MRALRMFLGSVLAAVVAATVMVASPTISQAEPCAPVFMGPEFLAAQSEAVTYSGKYGSGYLPDAEWTALDYRHLSDCQADTRMWYLKPTGRGAGYGFVFHDGGTVNNQLWTESFNGKTYNLKKKSVRKRLECRNTSLLQGNPSFENPPDQPNIEYTLLYLVPSIANKQLGDRYDILDPEWLYSFAERNAEQLDKFGSQRCYAAPKSTGPQKLVETEAHRWSGSSARIELWCNAFRCYTKKKSGTSPWTEASRSTQKFIFKENSVVVKPWKEKFL